ncbi:hypothetical protein [Roseisalinus antarcticus]|uniref:Uncharacterized protein n=1 Tax=Roseisalinus antarcticus TaxID=254357 RepID=A0A1Y5RZR9_9RHOB|nr:hypothetical protein [Roseisalinus antarcticus]SLN27929.1 hypothetical protein ROA7023_00918 [Roseisalinus antarcticus]
MLEPDENGVYLRLDASPMRRLFAVGVFYGLGGMVAWLALGPPLSMGARLGLLVLAFAALFQGEALRRATQGAILLTTAGLVDGSGRVLAALDEIERVERGTFAFKPSHGFLVVLKHRAPRAWVPGMWWRMGRRVGIGGVTAGSQGKAMADRLAMVLARRDAG